MSELLTRIRAAFDGDDVPVKNVMLRRAYDEIVALNFIDAQAWKPIAEAKKDGRLYLLLVYYGGNDINFPLEDGKFGRTIGQNAFEEDGEDHWNFAGWCWSHDHFTEGDGMPIAFADIPVAPTEIAADEFRQAALSQNPVAPGVAEVERQSDGA